MNCLNKQRSVAINIGGAREAIIEQTDKEVSLVLKERLGFVKLALQTKTPLVPVYTFGEHDMYRCVQYSGRLKTIMLKLQRICGFSLPLFVGVLGLCPFPRRVEVVVGAPIPTDDYTELSDEVIVRKHTEYCGALEALFEKHKEGFYAEGAKLKFV